MPALPGPWRPSRWGLSVARSRLLFLWAKWHSAYIGQRTQQPMRILEMLALAGLSNLVTGRSEADSSANTCIHISTTAGLPHRPRLSRRHGAGAAPDKVGGDVREGV